MTAIRDATRKDWVWGAAERLIQDVGHGWRALRGAPVVSSAAILSLALGIGANSAIFSVLDTLVLKSLPVAAPAELVLLGNETGRRTSWTNPIWEELRDRAGLFDGAFAVSSTRFNLATRGETEFVDGLWASGAMFDVLGVRATLGRTFTEADDRPGGGPDGPVAVISHGFWQRRFGGAPDAIGRTLTRRACAFHHHRRRAAAVLRRRSGPDVRRRRADRDQDSVEWRTSTRAAVHLVAAHRVPAS